jgi:hypothetical protein
MDAAESGASLPDACASSFTGKPVIYVPRFPGP